MLGRSLLNRKYVGLAIGILGLTVIYDVLAQQLHMQSIAGSGLSNLGADTAFAFSNAAGNVPNGVEQKLADSVGGVEGVNELVVFPSTEGSGYVVFATVDLGENPDQPTSLLSSTVQKDVSKFFRGIYSSDEPVVEADVYFMIGQRTVAGAGLGQTAYTHLATAAATNSGGLSQVLLSSEQRTTGGPEEEWLQIQPMGG